MEEMSVRIFLAVLNMSLTAVWGLLAVLLLRPLLRRAPKFVVCLLWGLAGVRLLLPIRLESVLSLIPRAEPISPSTAPGGTTPRIDTGIPALDSGINGALTSLAPQPTASADPLGTLFPVVALIWIIGVFAMLSFALISYLRLRKKTGITVPYADGVLLCDNIGTPFILGIFRPRIYLPSGTENLEEGATEAILAHERAHLARRDQLWKPLGYLILSLHWFNPLCWVAYCLLCRDIELACDEKVVKGMDLSARKRYAQTLLDCSIHRRTIAVCPLAFGEVGVGARVKKVLSYRKPAFWVLCAALLSCVVVAVCFLTNPKPVSVAVSPEMREHLAAEATAHWTKAAEENYVTSEVFVAQARQSGETELVYCWVLTAEYGCDVQSGQVEHVGGVSFPCVMRLEKTPDGYRTQEYRTPREMYYEKDLHTLFPEQVRKDFAGRGDDAMQAACDARGNAYYADAENSLYINGFAMLRLFPNHRFSFLPAGSIYVSELYDGIYTETKEEVVLTDRETGKVIRMPRGKNGKTLRYTPDGGDTVVFEKQPDNDFYGMHIYLHSTFLSYGVCEDAGLTLVLYPGSDAAVFGKKGGFAGKYTETEDTVRIRFLDGGSVCVFRKTENGLRFDSAVSSPIIYYRQESGDKPLTLEDGALFVYE